MPRVFTPAAGSCGAEGLGRGGNDDFFGWFGFAVLDRDPFRCAVGILGGEAGGEADGGLCFRPLQYGDGAFHDGHLQDVIPFRF